MSRTRREAAVAALLVAVVAPAAACNSVLDEPPDFAVPLDEALVAPFDLPPAPECDMRMLQCSDVGCGGACASPCGDGKNCLHRHDCTSLVCASGHCATPSCHDDVLNGDESDVDCGGACSHCANGQMCKRDGDCANAVCGGGRCVPASCRDGMRNGDETDVDCGGPDCAPCANAKMCNGAGDCVSRVCTMGGCAVATCNDAVRNGDETDVDCGGSCLQSCKEGQACQRARDCTDGVCGDDDKCAAPSCSDGIRNGVESDVDCGGMPCAPCADCASCRDFHDCKSGYCRFGVCATPTIAMGAPREILAVGHAPTALVAADLDQDPAHTLDLAVTDENPGGPGDVTILAGDGRLGFAWTATLGTGTAPWCLVARDLDGDGQVDLAVPTRGASNDNGDITLITRQNGFFIVEGTVSSGGLVGIVSIAAAAPLTDRSTLDDLLLGSARSDTWVLLENDGNFGFSPTEVGDVDEGGLGVGVGPFADADNDGMVTVGADQVSVFEGGPSGPSKGSRQSTPLLGARALAVGNLDGGDYPDVAVLADDGVHVLLDASPGQALVDKGAIAGSPGASATALALGDIDVDGTLDIVVSDGATGTVAIYPGHGDGSFGVPTVVSVATPTHPNPDPVGLLVEDLDGDGRPDVATANHAVDTVTVLRNWTP